jgi:CBS domain-containing protein
MGKDRALVADVMTADPVVVTADTTIEEADMIIRSTFVIGLPVVDRDGFLVGVIGNAHLAAHRFGRPSEPSEQSPATPAPVR